MNHGHRLCDGRITPLLASLVFNGAEQETFALEAFDQILEVEYLVVSGIAFNGQRHITSILDLLKVSCEIIPGSGHRRNASLGEDILVVPEHHRAVVVGHQIVNAVIDVQVKHTRVEDILESSAGSIQIR